MTTFIESNLKFATKYQRVVKIYYSMDAVVTINNLRHYKKLKKIFSNVSRREYSYSFAENRLPTFYIKTTDYIGPNCLSLCSRNYCKSDFFTYTSKLVNFFIRNTRIQRVWQQDICFDSKERNERVT